MAGNSDFVRNPDGSLSNRNKSELESAKKRREFLNKVNGYSKTIDNLLIAVKVLKDKVDSLESEIKTIKEKME